MRALIKTILEKVPEENRESFEVKVILEYSDLAEVPAKLNGESKYRYVVEQERLNKLLDFLGEEDESLVSLDNQVYSIERLPSGGVAISGSYPITAL